MSLDASIRENEAEHLIEFDAVGIRSTWNADQWMLQGWNWKVSTGDFWLVGGPAGCGKSEILSVASGLLKPARGRLRFFGREVQDLEPESWLDERLRLGLVFEDGGRVFQELTVYENLLLPLNYHGRKKDQASHAWIMQVLESLELTSMQHHVSGRLSRHWKQRLGLARALALQPEVLFMGLLSGILPVPGRLIQGAIRERIPPLGSGAGCKFPFGFCRQSVAVRLEVTGPTGLLLIVAGSETFQKGTLIAVKLGVSPANLFHRLVGMILPMGGIGKLDLGELPVGDLELVHQKSANRDFMGVGAIG